jgi:hypothetical protein
MKVQLDSWDLADSIDGMSAFQISINKVWFTSAFQFQSIRFGLLLVSIQVHDIKFQNPACFNSQLMMSTTYGDIASDDHK